MNIQSVLIQLNTQYLLAENDTLLKSKNTTRLLFKTHRHNAQIIEIISEFIDRAGTERSSAVQCIVGLNNIHVLYSCDYEVF